MCLLCIEFQKGGMTVQQAKNALSELINDPQAMEAEDWWHWIELDESDYLEEKLNEYEGDN